MLHVFTYFCMLCNYFWMFCEGLYLHTILLRVFSTGRRLIVTCHLIGWGIFLKTFLLFFFFLFHYYYIFSDLLINSKTPGRIFRDGVYLSCLDRKCFKWWRHFWSEIWHLFNFFQRTILSVILSNNCSRYQLRKLNFFMNSNEM